MVENSGTVRMNFEFFDNTCLYNDDSLADMKKWILLDNQSTVDLFCDMNLLSNIRVVKSTMSIATNGGTLITNKKGYLSGYGDVWFDERAITNILSLDNVTKKYRVTYDSGKDTAFLVHKPDVIIRFERSPSGLYYHAPENRSIMMLNTIDDNKKKYSNRQYSRALVARELYTKIGCPSINDFKQLVKNCLINNCPVTIEDIKICEDIFGPNVYNLKGKTTRTAPTPVIIDYVEVPRDILKTHKNVTLTGDIFFVQGYAFLVTLSRNIKYNTIEELDNMEGETILSALDHVLDQYTKRGFKVCDILMDMQFASLEDDLVTRGVNLNVASAKEHIAEIERFIRTIKERARAIRASLPFAKLPYRLVLAIITHVSKWLNIFCPKNSISDVISPRTLMTGVKLDYNRDCKLEIGTYVQVHEEPAPTNTIDEFRTTGAIALERTSNLQGGYYFLSLNTGRVLNRRKWTVLPMSNDVITRVNELADKEDHDFIFWDRHGNPNDDSSLTGVDDDDDDNDSDYNDENSQEELDNALLVEDNNNNEADGDEINNNNDLESVESNNEDEADKNDVDIVDELQQDFDDAVDEFEHLYEADEEDNDNNTVDEHQNQQQQQKTRSGRTIKKKGYLDYEPDFSNRKYESSNANIGIEHSDDKLLGMVFSQMFLQHNLHEGLKKYGNIGHDAALGELTQLHLRNAFKPRYASELTSIEKKKALGTIVLIEEKRDGRVKGRAVADGRKQRGDIPKEDAASPTTSLEAIILTSMIEAQENRDVVVADIPNAFIQTDMEGDTVFMKLTGKAAEILVQTAPELYRKYITIENGRVVLYVEALKAIYGTLKAALLFYKKLVKELKSIGFEINPYDPCVANKMINGKQCTVVWHVDDLKFSHKDTAETDNLIKWLQQKFEDDNIGKVKISRGKVHDYLGMKLDFSTPGEVKIDMKDYVKSMIECFPEKREFTATTPAALHLFEVRKDVKVLSEEEAMQFHTMVAKGLFLCKRARPDIQTTIAFLSTRVKQPDQDDWKKLRRLIDYLRGTMDLVLTLKADNTSIIKWYVDVAYAVHPDMRSHTGGAMTLGKGFGYATSTKQKLNTKSSTEAELVGCDDVIGQIIWTNYFLEWQGYNCSNTILYQDNKSAILLEKNGKLSSGKKTKHINIRYFFITDRIGNGELTVEYCPTDKMVADFLVNHCKELSLQSLDVKL